MNKNHGDAAMKLSILATAVALGLCTPAFAQSANIWEPCLSADPSMEGVIGAFQAEGWAFPTSNEEHVANLQTAAEPLFALNQLPNVETGDGFDRHIAGAHERAEATLIDAATLQRDGLIVAIEHYDNAGGMIRCTIAGNEFDEVAYAFDGDQDEIRTIGGHQIVLPPPGASAADVDVTLYRLLAPSDATAEARATFAAVAIRHLQ